jgi:subtilisin family serine protease
MLRFLLLWHHLDPANAGVKAIAAGGKGRWRIVTVLPRSSPGAVFAVLAAAWLAFAPRPAGAQHACDAAMEAGERVMPSREVTAVSDSAPFREGTDWLVERTTTVLPFCNYFTPVGSYSLRSYTLDPVQSTERVVICRAVSPVAPYTGPCPPN